MILSNATTATTTSLLLWQDGSKVVFVGHDFGSGAAYMYNAHDLKEKTVGVPHACAFERAMTP